MLRREELVGLESQETIAVGQGRKWPNLSLLPSSSLSPLRSSEDKCQKTYSVPTQDKPPFWKTADDTSDQGKIIETEINRGALLYFKGNGQKKPMKKMESKIWNHIFMLLLCITVSIL